MNDPTTNQLEFMPLELQISDRDIPAFSPLAVRSLQLLNDPGLTNDYFARLLQKDNELLLGQRILRVANSSYYAPRTPINNVADAISRIGRQQVYNTVLVAAVGKLYNSEDPYIQKLWNHAIATGIASLALAKSHRCSLLNEAFLAGLLHDIGKLIVYNRYPFLYWHYWCKAGYAHWRLDRIEAVEFPNLSHSAIGARVIRKWNLSEAVVAAASLHHDLESAIPNDSQALFLPCIVSLANVIVNNLGINAPVGTWPETASLACARFLKFDVAQVNPIRERLDQLFDIHRLTVDPDAKSHDPQARIAV